LATTVGTDAFKSEMAKTPEKAVGVGRTEAAAQKQKSNHETTKRAMVSSLLKVTNKC
jgi:hypothetical protein